MSAPQRVSRSMFEFDLISNFGAVRVSFEYDTRRVVVLHRSEDKPARSRDRWTTLNPRRKLCRIKCRMVHNSVRSCFLRSSDCSCGSESKGIDSSELDFDSAEAKRSDSQPLHHFKG